MAESKNSNPRARVVHVITGLATGGAERAMHNVISNGLADSYATSVISLTDEGRYGALFKEIDIPVYCLGMKRGVPSLSALIRYRKILKEIEPDLIQGWMYHGNLLASFARFFLKKRPKLVWNIRQCIDDLSKEKRLTRYVIRLGAPLSKCVESIIFNSAVSSNQHFRLGYQSSKAVVIPNGFCSDKFSFDSNCRTQERNAHGVGAADFVIGHVGRFHPMKDHATFLKAAVQAAGQHSDIKFLMIGTDVVFSNESLGGSIPDNLRERFLLLGERGDVEKLYSVMDMFCLSSNSEAFPNALGEAMVCGLPCITTDVGDSAYVLGEAGLIVPPSNSEALANAMTRMLDMGEAERKSLGSKARQRIEKNFSLGTIVQTYKDLYDGLLNS